MLKLLWVLGEDGFEGKKEKTLLCGFLKYKWQNNSKVIQNVSKDIIEYSDYI